MKKIILVALTLILLVGCDGIPFFSDSDSSKLSSEDILKNDVIRAIWDLPQIKTIRANSGYQINPSVEHDYSEAISGPFLTVYLKENNSLVFSLTAMINNNSGSGVDILVSGSNGSQIMDSRDFINEFSSSKDQE